MIKIISQSKNDTKKEVLCHLFADSETDVQPVLNTSIIPDGYKIAMGSKCTVANGSVYYYKSDDTWSKATEGGGGGGGDDRQATEGEVDKTIDDIVDDLHL